MNEVNKILITNAGMQALQAAIENPAEPTPALVELLRDAKQLPDGVEILGS